MTFFILCLHVATIFLGFPLGPSGMASDLYSSPVVQSADESVTVWGGQHIEMQLTKNGATLEFDCATGTITKPLAVDGRGKFRTSGTFTRERPGPTMRDGNPAVAATYSGSIDSDTMHLTITAGPNKESVGDYVLVRGNPGRVMKCR